MTSTPLVLVTVFGLAITCLGPIRGDQQPAPVTDDGEPAAVSHIQAAMESAEIVPDVVGKAPGQLIKVSVSSARIEFPAIVIAVALPAKDLHCHSELG